MKVYSTIYLSSIVLFSKYQKDAKAELLRRARLALNQDGARNLNGFIPHPIVGPNGHHWDEEDELDEINDEVDDDDDEENWTSYIPGHGISGHHDHGIDTDDDDEDGHGVSHHWNHRDHHNDDEIDDTDDEDEGGHRVSVGVSGDREKHSGHNVKKEADCDKKEKHGHIKMGKKEQQHVKPEKIPAATHEPIQQSQKDKKQVQKQHVQEKPVVQHLPKEQTQTVPVLPPKKRDEKDCDKDKGTMVKPPQKQEAVQKAPETSHQQVVEQKAPEPVHQQEDKGKQWEAPKQEVVQKAPEPVHQQEDKGKQWEAPKQEVVQQVQKAPEVSHQQHYNVEQSEELKEESQNGNKPSQWNAFQQTDQQF